MKIPRFRPREYPDRTLGWGVDIPAYLSPSKRSQRRFFLTLREAREFGAYMRRQYDDHLHGSTYLSRDQLAEAARAYAVIRELEPMGSKSYTLLGIVEDFAARVRQQSKSVTLDTLFDQYIDARRESSSEIYRQQLGWCKQRMVRLGHRMVSTITTGELESVLRREAPSSRNAFIRYLGAVIRWGAKRGYMADGPNPVAGLELSPVKPQEVQIYTVDEVQRMLDDCLESDLGLLPYRILTLYCGVRPTGEMSRVEWGHLNWDERVLKLHAGITKKGRTRFINVSDNAMRWLEEYQRRGGPTEAGKIAGWTRDRLEARLKANCRRTGVKLIKNGSRHSYCSYYLANGGDINQLTLQSGHASTQVLWNHYYQTARREDAQRYWSIVPKAAATNVVAFNA